LERNLSNNVSFSTASSRLTVPLIIVIGCLLALVFMIATSPSQLRYDERNHVGLAELVTKSGWHAALLSSDNRSAAGPLFPAIHLTLAPLTHLRPPAIRWVNFFCFLGVVLLLASYETKLPLEARIFFGFTLLAVPFLWPALGMALTELPALLFLLLFFTCFVILFLRVTSSDLLLSREVVWVAFVAGVCLGAAILGRQTYLVILPVLIVMMFWLREKWAAVLVCIITSLAICCWLFALWHGLAPPHYYQLAHSSLSLSNLLLSLSYAATATLFLNPRWLAGQGRIHWIICALFGVALTYLARSYEDPPAKSLLVQVFGMDVGLWVGFALGCVIAALGVGWAWTAFKTFSQDRRDAARVFLLLSLGALLLAPMKMTAQFSSRYIVGCLGVLILVVASPCQSRRYGAARMVVGTFLGMAILWTYYHQG
jgi:hypothetical protein